MKYITQKQLSEKLEPINLQALIAQETNDRMRVHLFALPRSSNGQIFKSKQESFQCDWAKKFFNEELTEKTKSEQMIENMG